MATSMMQRSPATLVRSSVGKKMVMAVTGLLLFLFVFVHMLGNLKVFTGQEHFNKYADFLKTIGAPALGHEWYLWGQRTVLLAALVLHLWGAWSTYQQSTAARPVRYSKPATVQASVPAVTMRWGGIAILLFIVFHLLNLTTGTIHPGFVSGQAYANVVKDFKVWYVDLVYFLALGALGMHLFHGLWSSFQTLGRNTPQRDKSYRKASKTIAAVVTLGYAMVPVAVILGIVH